MEDLLIKLSSALGAKEHFPSIGKALDQAELEVCGYGIRYICIP
jgi:hypothetical protein